MNLPRLYRVCLDQGIVTGVMLREDMRQRTRTA